MYEQFFGLKEKPFNMTPDTRYFYPSAKHTDAINHMVYSIEERRGFVVITGEIGSGKTTISRILLGKLDPATKTAIIRNTQLTARELLALTLDELEIPHEPKMTKAQLINRFNGYLIEQLAQGSNVVLLIDEAQNLKASVLEEVRMLSNLETEREKLVQIILMGQPELRSKLWLKDLTQLRQRVVLYYHLTPLDESETAAYVTHRLHVAAAGGGGTTNPSWRVAGANSKPIFASNALSRIFYHSQGIPRLINSICDRALLTGYINDAATLGPGVIDEVAGELPALVEEGSACAG